MGRQLLGWLRYVWRDVLHPCPDCRRWWGRHDEAVEHQGGWAW